MATLELRVTRWAAFREFFDRAEHIDINDMLESFSGLMVSQTQRRINEEKTAPDGTPWAPWSERYENYRERKGIPNHRQLILSGDLLNSIYGSHTAKSVRVQAKTVVQYANTHQFGNSDKNIPARPFVGLSDENREELREAGIDYLKSVLGID